MPNSSGCLVSDSGRLARFSLQGDTSEKQLLVCKTRLII